MRERSKSVNIAWLDVETSGLEPERHSLLEIAVIITNMKGASIGVKPYTALVEAPDLGNIIKTASPESHMMHQKSGLWSDLWSSKDTKSLKKISKDLTSLFHSCSGDLFLVGGTSLFLDLSYVRINLPEVYSCLSHLTVDTASLKIFVDSLTAQSPFMRKGLHRALPDVEDSIREYQHYLELLKEG